MNPAPLRLLYLHGFRSSGQSEKAQYLARHGPWQLLAPDLPDRPAEAIPFLERLLDELHRSPLPLALIGTSLGAFYADRFAHRRQLPAILINPLLESDWMRQAIGPNRNLYTQSLFTIDEADIAAMYQLDRTLAQPAPPLLLLHDEGDELFDFRRADAHYRDRAEIHLYPGGCHRFDHLPEAMATIERFLGT